MRFRILNKDFLFDYREACKITQGRDLALEVEHWKPKNEVEFWIKQIVANHSTLRSIQFRLVDSRPKSVVMQLIRATKGHPQPAVQSSRPDWMAKQRLCARTEERTRKAMQEMVDALKHSKEPFLKAVGYCCMPYCGWYGACPEIRGCGKNVSLARHFINIYTLEKSEK